MLQYGAIFDFSSHDLVTPRGHRDHPVLGAHNYSKYRDIYRIAALVPSMPIIRLQAGCRRKSAAVHFEVADPFGDDRQQLFHSLNKHGIEPLISIQPFYPNIPEVGLFEERHHIVGLIQAIPWNPIPHRVHFSW